MPLKKAACPLKGGEAECDKHTNLKVNLKEVKLSVLVDGKLVPIDEVDVKGELQVKLSENVGIKIRHPRFSDLSAVQNVNKTEPKIDEVGIELIAHCITDFFDAENVYPASDYSIEERIKFVEDLDRTSMQVIHDFFKTIPKMRHNCEFICGTAGCNVREPYKIEGLSNFFD